MTAIGANPTSPTNFFFMTFDFDRKKSVFSKHAKNNLGMLLFLYAPPTRNGKMVIFFQSPHQKWYNSGQIKPGIF